MRVIIFLLRASWRVALLAGLIGALSGAASAALVALISYALRGPDPSSAVLIELFAALCAVILLTRVVSQVLLCRLTANCTSQLRLGLCRRILESPLRHLEEIGDHRMLAALTNDVAVVSQALNGVPSLGINLVVLISGAVYLGTLSLSLMAGAAVFCLLGMATYWYSSEWAERYIKRARESQDVVFKHIRELIEGIKELKTHQPRRLAFFEQVVRSEGAVRRRQFLGESLYDAAVSWGRLMFFIAIGLLLFAWPRLARIDPETLSAYTLIIFYLMSPLDEIMGWLPFMGRASASVDKIEELGLMLDAQEAETAAAVPIRRWEQIDLVGVTHTYRREGQPHDFVLGPIDLALVPGEIVFVIGGNGSGKTTLAKLLAGLYTPGAGEIRLDGRAITAENRESYRQLFSVVFDGAAVFDNLWGLEGADLDQRGREYLRQLQLDHAVTITNGSLSTTALSRGQRKRLALLTAWLEDRPICLFDEWAADQDPAFRKVFYLDLLPELRRRGKTVVAITHDDRYFAAADRIIKLEEGRLVETSRQEAPQEAPLEMR
ncbi:MAG: cyclic peptide export ABC transporter [Thermoguttaceae bacterium]|jgi:putative ATP-binding cassette transporter